MPVPDSLLCYGNAPRIVLVTAEGTFTREPGDTDGNGSADLSDALLILQYDCGWDVSLQAKQYRSLMKYQKTR